MSIKLYIEPDLPVLFYVEGGGGFSGFDWEKIHRHYGDENKEYFLTFSGSVSALSSNKDDIIGMVDDLDAERKKLISKISHQIVIGGEPFAFADISGDSVSIFRETYGPGGRIMTLIGSENIISLISNIEAIMEGRGRD